VVYDIKKDYVLVGDPALPKTAKMSAEAFKTLWQGQIVTFEPTENFKSEDKQKGAFTKFFGYILSQKKMLTFVVITSLLISLINVAGSFVFESVIQKVEMQSIEAVMDLEEDEHEHNHEHDEDEHNHDDDDEDEEEIYDYMSADTRGSRISKLIESLNSKFNGKLDVILSSLNSICIAVICLYFFQLILQVLRGYLLAKTAKLVDVPLTMSYYNHLLDLPAGFYGTRKTGEYMSRFNDTGNIRTAVSSATLTIILDTIMAVACGILLFYINSRLFLITCVVIAVYTAIMFAFKNPLKDINYKIMEQESQVVSYLKESIDGIETIKSYNYMPFAKNKTKNLYEKLADYTVRGSVVSTVQDSLVSAVASVGLVVLLWAGADLCIKGVIELSDLMIFYPYHGRIPTLLSEAKVGNECRIFY